MNDNKFISIFDFINGKCYTVLSKIPLKSIKDPRFIDHDGKTIELKYPSIDPFNKSLVRHYDINKIRDEYNMMDPKNLRSEKDNLFIDTLLRVKEIDMKLSELTNKDSYINDSILKDRINNLEKYRSQTIDNYNKIKKFIKDNKNNIMSVESYIQNKIKSLDNESSEKLNNLPFSTFKVTTYLGEIKDKIYHPVVELDEGLESKIDNILFLLRDIPVKNSAIKLLIHVNQFNYFISKYVNDYNKIVREKLKDVDRDTIRSLHNEIVKQSKELEERIIKLNIPCDKDILTAYGKAKEQLFVDPLFINTVNSDKKYTGLKEKMEEVEKIISGFNSNYKPNIKIGTDDIIKPLKYPWEIPPIDKYKIFSEQKKQILKL